MSRIRSGLKLFYSTGNIVTESLRQKFREVFPRQHLIITYGLSEALIIISSTASDPSNEGQSVGFILPNIRVKVINAQGELAGIGETGEVLAKPEFKFLGYCNDPEKSKNSLDPEGFIKTGDIGFVNGNGLVSIINRKNEIIEYGGLRVNPSEIEDLVASIDGVEQVSVVAIPDPISTYRLSAAIVKKPNFDKLSEKMIIDYVAARMPEYKQLHGVREYRER